jgi:hypothetical protein
MIVDPKVFWPKRSTFADCLGARVDGKAGALALFHHFQYFWNVGDL